MGDFSKILQDVRDSADYLLALPERLVDAYYNTKIAYYSKKERVARLKELVDLREIGKSLQSLYLTKGSLAGTIRSIQQNPTPERIQALKERLVILNGRLTELSKEMINASISDHNLMAEAAFRLGQAANFYQALAEVPDPMFCDLDFLEEAYAHIEDMLAAGSKLISAVDEQRKWLDYSYGD
jgi:hypothetical protein